MIHAKCGRPMKTGQLQHIAGTKWSAKRYMNMNLLKQHKMSA